MKPLPTTPPTREDAAIWNYLWVRWFPGCRDLMFAMYGVADQRDACLMRELGLLWSAAQWCRWEPSTRHSALAFQGLRSSELVPT